jgi:hypothetical protein
MADGVVQIRKLTVAQTVAHERLVKHGIDPGSVIVEGLQYARAGQKANAWRSLRATTKRTVSRNARRRIEVSKHAVAFLHRPADLRVVIANFHRRSAGALAIVRLPVEQYPSIAPPQVVIQTTYPGASAETAQNSSRR